MGSCEHYRRQAEDLEREARRASSPAHAEELMKLAKGWRDLAQEAERRQADWPGTPSASATDRE